MAKAKNKMTNKPGSKAIICDLIPKSPDKLSKGATIDPSAPAGTTTNNKTGGWRTERPVRSDKCTKCMMCWMYCPDNAIGTDLEFDYDYCKGCGICAEICPVKCIEMKKEEK